MTSAELPLNKILQGDCIEILSKLPENSIDLIFADPPYNLQLQRELWRPNLTLVEAVNDSWDQFPDLKTYDEFSRNWLTACQRVLKNTGTIWVIGTYHNIYRLGAILQDLGFWFLNDIVWIKTNPMPNFRGVRFTNAHETLIWASKTKGAKYTFNYHAMKALNDDLQMRSDWQIPLCSSPERIRVNGKKAHSTQKPQALLYRILLASSNPGDVVLDPFFGTGTTGAMAKILHRHWIGIEQDPRYIEIARTRIDGLSEDAIDPALFEVRDRKVKEKRIPIGSLLEAQLLYPGQALYFRGERDKPALIKPNGHLVFNGIEGSIHQVGRTLTGGSPYNGWEYWYYEDQEGNLVPLNALRDVIRHKSQTE
jgi:site-specific DNA-methyltransferase (adenine-specific)